MIGATGREGPPGRALDEPGGPPGTDATVVEARVELDEAELERWGRRLGAAAIRAAAFVALHGPLGAGKTRLVQAACRGAGVDERALSPTFTLVHRYRGEAGPVWHVDLYRIEGPAEVGDLGWDELVGSGAPVFVEWAERAGERLPPDRWEVWLAYGSTPDRRRVGVAARGEAPAPPPLREDEGMPVARPGDPAGAGP